MWREEERKVPWTGSCSGYCLTTRRNRSTLIGPREVSTLQAAQDSVRIRQVPRLQQIPRTLLQTPVRVNAAQETGWQNDRLPLGIEANLRHDDETTGYAPVQTAVPRDRESWSESSS